MKFHMDGYGEAFAQISELVFIYIYKKIYRGLLNFEFQKLIIMDNIARTNFFIE